MDALVTKLVDMRLLQPNHFRVYLVNTLIDRWFHRQPRELFQIMMATEYKWRIALHVSMEDENDVMIRASEAYEGASAGGDKGAD
jgi:hypothetical protein